MSKTAIIWDNRIVKRADVPPDQLLANPKNFRRHTREQKDAFRGLVVEVGYIDPVLCTLDDTVIDGHLRVEVALEDGIATIPVDYYDGTSEQADLILATKDPLAAMAYHDNSALNALLAELHSDDAAIQALLDSLSGDVEIVTDGLTDPDDVPPVPEVPVTKPGDLWLLGRHRLLCGDATVVTDVERLMDGAKADMVFTDPPYGVDYQGGHFHSGDVHIVRKRERLANDQRDIYGDVVPIIGMFLDGPCYIWFADRGGEPVYSSLAKSGFENHALIIWHKINATYAAMNAQYKQRHECCLYVKPRGSTLRWVGPTDECTVWEMKRDPRNDLHPTQKPVELAERAIKNHNADLILDLFGGSGSTLIACEQTGRRCAMMEISPAYTDVIVKRWENFTGSTAVRAHAPNGHPAMPFVPFDDVHPRDTWPTEPCEQCGTETVVRPDHPGLMMPICDDCKAMVAT